MGSRCPVVRSAETELVIFMPPGSESLPEGIISKTSNFEFQPLWGSSLQNKKPKASKNLLAVAVGIKQRHVVSRIIEKFPPDDFDVILFHYDGVVDEWREFSWYSRALHVSALNQTKWWFAKRFLHPDIVAEYNYIFLWDEDLGVEYFDPKRYVSILKEEGLEISQPALDPVKSKVHQPLTARKTGSKVHRRFYNFKGAGRCYANSTGPPCTGWVEMMAPVFSRAGWRCTWYMIQNDLIHAWGLDRQLGYCAQGDRTKKVGVVDAEYIVHLGLPTLGASHDNALSFSIKLPSVHYGTKLNFPFEQLSSNALSKKDSSNLDGSEPQVDNRVKVRMQSSLEMQIFKDRWADAAKTDRSGSEGVPVSINRARTQLEHLGLDKIEDISERLIPNKFK
ncbi:GTPase Der [Cucumis melo var. makuwa]|uniref:GTPase Der n=1 Tax=Cucumis melo var. makuwa TaxID=1194695 RepID=A0A5A7VE88_CUCMM|nr:GTPase Der [Cucumis melo var. makuwa]